MSIVSILFLFFCQAIIVLKLGRTRCYTVSMKTKNNKIIQFDFEEEYIYIRKNIIGINENCTMPVSVRKITVQKNNPIFCVRGNCLIEIKTKRLILGGSKMNIPNDGSVEIIGKHAFAGRFWEGNEIIVLPSSIKIIEEGAFSLNDGLQIILNEGVKVICRCAFRGGALSFINIPSTVKKIGRRSFANCKIKNLVSKNIRFRVQEDGLVDKRTGDLIAVRHTEKIILPDGIKRITPCLFNGGGDWRKIYIPPSVQTIQSFNFLDCYYGVEIFDDFWEDFTTKLFVHEGTIAHQYAVKNRLVYQLIEEGKT